MNRLTMHQMKNGSAARFLHGEFHDVDVVHLEGTSTAADNKEIVKQLTVPAMDETQMLSLLYAATMKFCRHSINFDL